jgi:hypothetical protein
LARAVLPGSSKPDMSGFDWDEGRLCGPASNAGIGFSDNVIQYRGLAWQTWPFRAI